MAGREPEEAVRLPASRQEWRTMTFLHWSYDVSLVRPLVPSRVELDTWEGKAWVSMTPFRMTNFRVGALAPLPGLSTFPETNLRTYVRSGDGRDGLWFLSLEADSLATVVGASATYGVPYRWAEMTVEEGETIRYRSRRRIGEPVGHDIRVRMGRPCQPSALDDWLTGRWRAWTTIAGVLASIPVEHAPWPLWDATVVDFEESLLDSVGLPKPEEPPLVHYSPGVSVRLGAPRFRSARKSR
ncbi:MAG: DUF2071 domain-containing protein [Actinomycetota bacterium]|nr:DUF2071 domain-containing protein [Actinomycetota bacterium]